MVIFNNRLEAGEILAEKFKGLKNKLKNPIVLGIPRGGMPIGYRVAKALGSSLDTVVLRKLPMPHNPEAGFGAVTLDKVAVYNEALLSQINLTKFQINRIVNDVYKEVQRRNAVYRKDKPFPILTGRSVILTDDGLASGFTMLAAIEFCKKRKVKEIIVSAPVAHREAYNLVNKEANQIVVLHISDLPYFAVASFYKEFPDMSDEEVVFYLKESGEGFK